MTKTLRFLKIMRFIFGITFPMLCAFGSDAIAAPNACQELFSTMDQGSVGQFRFNSGLKLFEFYGKDTTFDFFSFSEGALSGFKNGQWVELGPATYSDGLITLSTPYMNSLLKIITPTEVHMSHEQAAVFFKATELQPLTEANRNALTLFAQGRMDTPINLILRGSDKASNLSADQVASAKQLISELDRAFSFATPLPLGLNLHRGISNHSIYGALQKGTVFVDQGYSSTSIDPKVALRFAMLALSKSNSTAGLIQTMVIKINSELVQGLYVPSAVGDMFAGNEFEVLIKRGQKYKVIEVTDRKSDSGYTFRTITIETVGP